MTTRKTGRPRFEATDEQRKHVLISAGIGVSHKRIAAPLGINVKTLKKYFAKELREGFSYLCEMADKSLLKLIGQGNLTAIIWFDKTRRGMKEGMGGEQNTLPPPQLGISFAAGGPGLERTEAYCVETDDSMLTPPGQDRLPGSESHERPPPVEPPRPTQEFLPKQITHDPEPPPTSPETWERLAMTPEQFAKVSPPQPPVEEDWGQRVAREARLHPQWRGRGSGSQ